MEQITGVLCHTLPGEMQINSQYELEARQRMNETEHDVGMP